MFILGNFCIAAAKVLGVLLSMAYWLILIRALSSWLSPDPRNQIMQFLYRTTEPILQPVRRLMPRSKIDLSPIIVFIAILFLKEFLVQSLFGIGMRLQG